MLCYVLCVCLCRHLHLGELRLHVAVFPELAAQAPDPRGNSAGPKLYVHVCVYVYIYI